MTWALLLLSAGLAAIAAAGILRPFGKAAPSIEPLADPLEDERDTLLRSLRDLQEEHAAKSLSDADYRLLRRETERRAVTVLRAIDARDGTDGAGPATLREQTLESESSQNGHRPAPAAGPVWIAAAALGGLVLVGILLASAIAPRNSSQPITGDSQITGSGASALSFFEQRVKDHPSDVAARLDLASRYQAAGLTGLAAEQYVEALRLDPNAVEARSALGLLLYEQGRAKDGLFAENQALRVDPSYPEALYDKGIILLKGLHQKAPAVIALRGYLAAAPDGAHRAEVEGLLAATAGAASTSPSPTATSPGA
jgi:tetratricopeptide (TPR) repeat protein